MSPVQSWLIKLLIEEVTKLITPELVKKAEVELIVWLRAQAASTPNTLDDSVVDAVAKALGVA